MNIRVRKSMAEVLMGACSPEGDARPNVNLVPWWHQSVIEVVLFPILRQGPRKSCQVDAPSWRVKNHAARTHCGRSDASFRPHAEPFLHRVLALSPLDLVDMSDGTLWPAVLRNQLSAVPVPCHS